MPPTADIATLLLGIIGFWLCFLGPAHVWWPSRTSGLTPTVARLAASAAWTTILGLGLTASGMFSLPTIVLINGLLTLAGYLQAVRSRDSTAPAGARDRRAGGLVVVLAALAFYLPAYSTFYGGADSSTYLATGVHLARTGALAVPDPLGPKLPPHARRVLFDSAYERPWLPPYRRTGGGLVLENHEAEIAWPGFFPVPAVWIALFTSMWGLHGASAYACVFAAFALWPLWLILRHRSDPLTSAAAIGALAVCAPMYWTARFPLSETIALFFVWSGLAAWDAWEEEGFAQDAGLAALCLGTAVLTRVEIGLYLAGAAALVLLLRAPLSGRRPPRRFAVTGLALCAMLGLQIATIPGGYLAPLQITAAGNYYNFVMAWRADPLLVGGCVLAAVSTLWLLVKVFGLKRAILGGGLAGTLAFHFLIFESHFLRYTGWLQDYLGLPTLLLAILGGYALWRTRHTLTGNLPLVAVVGITAAILLWNAHVTQALPWAGRRFVPILLPGIFVLAAAGISWVGERSRIAATAAAAAMVMGVVPAGQTLWAKPLYGDTLKQLAQLDEIIPRDGTLVVDKRLDGRMLDTALWLLRDRPSLPIHSSPPAALELESNAIWRTFGREEPVYLLAPASVPMLALPHLRHQRIAEYTLDMTYPENTVEGIPRRTIRQNVVVSVNRIRGIPPVRKTATGGPSAATRNVPMINGQPLPPGISPGQLPQNMGGLCGGMIPADSPLYR